MVKIAGGTNIYDTVDHLIDEFYCKNKSYVQCSAIDTAIENMLKVVEEFMKC